MWLAVGKLFAAINRCVERTGAQYKAYGIFGLFNFPIYYVIWLFFDEQSYENIWLRGSCVLLCLLLVLHDHWPKRLKPFLPVFWYFTLMFTLPFFFTFMLLLNHGSIMWITNTIVIVFFTLLLVDWLSALILLLLGSTLAFVSVNLFTQWSLSANFDYLGFMITYVVSIIIGSLFSRNKDVLERMRRRAFEIEANSKATSEFIANMNHDIRTPVTGILGLAQGFYDNAQDNRQANDARLLIRTTEQLLNLLNEVVETVNVKQDGVKQQHEVFSVRQLVEHNTALIHSAVSHKRLDLSVTMDQKLPAAVSGNRTYLDRILLNLLGNAVKFTESGSIGCHVSVIKTEKQTVWVEFLIRDTGIGISADKYDHIFEQFSRLTPSYKGLYKGSGLGLFMVKRYLNAMMGTIDVKSREGRGSTFTVKVPFQLADASQLILKPLDLAEKIIQRPTRKFCATVLVVEDNELAGRMVAEILLKCGCRVDMAHTGKVALYMAARRRYDLVFMDIGLPDADGVEVAQQLRRSGETQQLPIIALTGHLTEHLKQLCEQAGMQATVTKPISVAAVQMLLGRYAPQAEKDEAMDAQIIDLEAGAELAGGSQDSAKEMILLLIEKLPDDLLAVQEYLEQKQYQQLYNVVHKLYGGLCYCGTPVLRETVCEFKQLLKDKDHERLEAQLLKVEQAAEQVCEAAKQL